MKKPLVEKKQNASEDISIEKTQFAIIAIIANCRFVFLLILLYSYLWGELLLKGYTIQLDFHLSDKQS